MQKYSLSIQIQNKMMNEMNTKFYIFFILFLMKTVSLKSRRKNRNSTIYILMWTQSEREPFMYWKKESDYLVVMNCKYQNCYLTDRRDFFDDVTRFDVLLFNSVNITDDMDLPLIRTDRQIYVFVSTDSAVNFPVKSNIFNSYFNYTWTYKMDSDIPFPYITVRDKAGNILGPKVDMEWLNGTDMLDIRLADKERLQNKSVAAGWFVTNCIAVSNRLDYVRRLRIALSKYEHTLDTYGHCGDKRCDKINVDNCLKFIESDFYFYLSFENSISEDYVTEKLLSALENHAVPIVLGGADYSRFMPPDIYLNANIQNEEEIAKKINELINNKEMYYEYFKWRRYYTYHASTISADSDPLCQFCAFLNNRTFRNRRRTYWQFTEWWNEFENKNSSYLSPVITYESRSPKDKPYYIYKLPGLPLDPDVN